MRECECCGMPVWDTSPVCEGCACEGECPPADTWHCDGRYGHQCDGTGCDAYRSERDTEMVAWLADAIRRNVGS